MKYKSIVFSGNELQSLFDSKICYPRVIIIPINYLGSYNFKNVE